MNKEVLDFQNSVLTVNTMKEEDIDCLFRENISEVMFENNNFSDCFSLSSF